MEGPEDTPFTADVRSVLGEGHQQQAEVQWTLDSAGSEVLITGAGGTLL